MHKRVALSMIGLALTGSILACAWQLPGSQVVVGSGKTASEDRNVANINAVELAMPGTLDVSIGDTESLTIEADDNLLPYIQAKVSAGKLLIQTKPGTSLRLVSPIKYHLTVILLNAAASSSSGDITLPDLKSENFSISLSSSGDLTMQSLECSSLRVEVSSSGDARLSALTGKTLSVIISSSGNVDIGNGSVTSQTIRISSSGDFNARNLSSETADVNLSSNGDATLSVSTSLTGSLSSSGNLNYIGSPSVNVNTSSSGRVKQVQ